MSWACTTEAGTELARVHKDALSTGGLLYYYHTQRAYHGWLADYTAYQPAKEKYLKITEAYRDSILSIIGPGLSTDIVRAERLLLAGNPDEALSLLASHDEDGMTMPNRAYLNYTLFEAGRRRGMWSTKSTTLPVLHWLTSVWLPANMPPSNGWQADV